MSWDVWLSNVVSAILLPPGLILLTLLVSLLLLRSFRRSAIALMMLATSVLLLLSLPRIADSLLQNLESSTPLSAPLIKAIATDSETNRAIVVLSAGRIPAAPEYGQIDTVSSRTLQRLQYTSWLHKRVNLPILLSGGSTFNEATAEAVLMNQVMMDSFAIAPRWIESKSKNITENARFSAAILNQNDVQEILLVTHAWRMQRARRAFEAFGLRVIEAPMGFHTGISQTNSLLHFLPSATALEQSCRAIEETVSNWW